MVQRSFRIDFSLHPDLLSKQLGTDMYRAPEALKQLVANALDSGCTRVEVRICFNWSVFMVQ